jgi:hypothetical protein
MAENRIREQIRANAAPESSPTTWQALKSRMNARSRGRPT